MLQKHPEIRFGNRCVRLSRRLARGRGMTAIVAGMLVLGLAASTALAQKRGASEMNATQRNGASAARNTVGGSGSKSRPRPDKPTLFVQEYSGDFAQWVAAKTIDGPEDSLFSFQNKLADVVGARWQLSTQPMPSDDLSNGFPGFLGSGAFEPPAHGKAKVISVNWKHLVPAKPAAGTKYYFRVVADQGANESKPVLASNTVVITTKKSSFVVKFTAEGLGLTVKQKHPAMFDASPMPIEIDLQKLYIGNDNEDDDEPYLFVAVVYADGTTINPLAMSTSMVRIDSPTKTHGNVPEEDPNGDDLEEGSTAKIPAATGHFEKTIKPIGVDFAADLEDADGAIGNAMANGTAVYVVVVALEEDNTTTEAINAARATMIAELFVTQTATGSGYLRRPLNSG